MEKNNIQTLTESSRSLEEFEEDSKWFYENISFLRENNLAGKFVAIKSRNVIASDENIEIVIRSLEKQGKNPAYVLIEFVYPKGTVILL